MLFNSLDFAVFLPIVFTLYWFVTNKNLTVQNSYLLFASYIFYGWWDWRFLLLLLFSTVIDYSVGIGLSWVTNPRRRKALLLSSICVNLGLLGFFKYYNFFADNFSSDFTFFGKQINPGTLHIILPVGISFYTFQSLSYAIDVYKRKLEPTRNFIAFSAFVSFFPQLVAGPIERATHMLPQFKTHRIFEYSKAVDGLRQILWGLFKKMAIADNCADFANEIFNNSHAYAGSTLALGAVFFTFQIYGDFSGYSDIALGTARLFGFELMMNFNFPYFSRDIAEFWRRWHISLSSWFRDYVYLPLGGNRGSTLMKIRNTFVVFILSGFWHGANWTFIAWGLLNALFFLPLLLTKSNRDNLGVIAQGKPFPNLKELCSLLFTFGLTVFAWIFFRADNIGHAFEIVSEIFSSTITNMPEITKMGKAATTAILILLFIAIEWRGREDKYGIESFGLKWSRVPRWTFYVLVVYAIMVLGGNQQEFIYFQF